MKSCSSWSRKKLSSFRLFFIIFTMMISFLGKPSLSGGAEAPKASASNSKVTQPSTVDFCSNTSRFDFRNAYWLGTLADHAYLGPEYVIPIISGLAGAVIAQIPFFDKKENQNQKPMMGMGLGAGPSSVKFYTSSKQKPGEGTNQSENIYNRWVTPLPAEACIRPECRECFLGSSFNGNNDSLGTVCKKRCGDKNTKAYFEKDQLLSIVNKTKSSLNLTEDEKAIKSQVDKYVNKFKSMKKYAGQSLEINGVPIWMDPKTAERCEQHSLNKDVVADTQAYIIENDEAIFILFRGTEDNPADIKLDMKALDQFTFSKASNMKGAVHEGFYIAHIALRNFIRESLEESIKKTPNKPVFITGHSLGGAIGHIAMYSLLTAKKMGLPVNLKSIYTFGAPRVGNKEFGMSYTQLAKELGVGVYNIANENDMVPHVPCTDYNHAGAMIYVSRMAVGGKGSTKAIYKPNKFNRSSIFTDPSSCGYISTIKNIFSINSILSEHKMTTYVDRLSDLREQLHDQMVSCDKDSSSSHFDKIKLPENIKLNFQGLAADLED